jgi:hypothetical protein
MRRSSLCRIACKPSSLLGTSKRAAIRARVQYQPEKVRSASAR